MPTLDVKISCQRCGTPMTMVDPGPNDPWRPDQYWTCPKCGRHFWSTYPAPAQPAAAEAAAAAKPAAAQTAPVPTAPVTPAAPAAPATPGAPKA